MTRAALVRTFDRAPNPNVQYQAHYRLDTPLRYRNQYGQFQYTRNLYLSRCTQRVGEETIIVVANEHGRVTDWLNDLYLTRDRVWPSDALAAIGVTLEME